MDCCKEPPHILWEVVEVPLARSPSPVPLRREEKGHLHGVIASGKRLQFESWKITIFKLWIFPLKMVIFPSYVSKITIFNREINYFDWAIFNSYDSYVSLPEGKGLERNRLAVCKTLFWSNHKSSTK